MMERKHQRAMLASIIHIVNGDWASLVLDLTEMDVVPPNTNLRRVTMVIHQTVAVCVCIWRGGGGGGGVF